MCCAIVNILVQMLADVTLISHTTNSLCFLLGLCEIVLSVTATDT